jgi:Tfp pilus assembly protein PilO
MAGGPSTKRKLIDRANSTVVIVTSVAAVILVFSLVATKTLVGQAGYQNRVINEKHKTLTQLKSDITAANQLDNSYKKFTGTQQNAIGGNLGGSGPQDGDNAKIVLDALPSTYDFPALVTSLQTMLSSQPVKINSISGFDDEIAQGANQTSATPTPQPIPFQASVTGDYKSIQGVIAELEHSIRPIQVQKLDLSGSQDKLTLNITAQTFYQPAKTLNITQKVVK